MDYTNYKNFLGVLGFGILGFCLAAWLESNMLATQIALFSVLIINISAIYIERLLLVKSQLRYLTASFLFGVLIGVYIT